MLHLFLSLPAFVGEHLALAATLAALSVVVLLGRVAVLLAADRYPEPRHRPLALPAAPISAPPAPQLALPAAPFDPLDAATPLDEVELFLADLEPLTGPTFEQRFQMGRAYAELAEVLDAPTGELETVR